MKTNIIGIFAIMMALCFAPAFAATTVWTTVSAPMGETHFTQTHATQGAWYGDNNGGTWSGYTNPAGVTTAFTTEAFTNVGSVSYNSTFATGSDYNSYRTSGISATGTTNYTYTFEARSLCTGKAEDATHYEVQVNAWTQSGDQAALPGLGVFGTAPGYAGDDASSWASAAIVGNHIETNEVFLANSFTWVNPQN